MEPATYEAWGTHWHEYSVDGVWPADREFTRVEHEGDYGAGDRREKQVETTRARKL